MTSLAVTTWDVPLVLIAIPIAVLALVDVGLISIVKGILRRD